MTNIMIPQINFPMISSGLHNNRNLIYIGLEIDTTSTSKIVFK